MTMKKLSPNVGPLVFTGEAKTPQRFWRRWIGASPSELLARSLSHLPNAPRDAFFFVSSRRYRTGLGRFEPRLHQNNFGY
jgi:hypothetical protein